MFEEYANFDNPYISNWKIHDQKTGLPKEVSWSYFVFPDEIDMLYEGNKIINSGHPTLSEIPVHIFPLTITEIELEQPWVDPEDKNGESIPLPSLEEEFKDIEDQSDESFEDQLDGEFDAGLCLDKYLKIISMTLTVLFIFLSVAICILSKRI